MRSLTEIQLINIAAVQGEGRAAICFASRVAKQIVEKTMSHEVDDETNQRAFLKELNHQACHNNTTKTLAMCLKRILQDNFIADRPGSLDVQGIVDTESNPVEIP